MDRATWSRRCSCMWHRLSLAALLLASAAEALSDWLQLSTYLNCTGHTISTHQCHFKSLMYDRLHNVFVAFEPSVYGRDEARASALQAATLEPDAFLQPGWNSYHREPSGIRLRLQYREFWHRPPSADLCVIEQPIHIRSPIMTRSYGHFIRDNLPFLLEAPLKFGRNPDNFTWVKWPTTLKFSDVWVEHNSHVLEKYTQLLTDAAPIGWQQLLDDKCGSREGRRLRGRGGSVKRYVLLKEAISGLGRMARYPQCTDELFRRVRDNAFRRIGVDGNRRAKKDKIRVTFVGHHDNERRRMLGVNEAITDLQGRFPAAEFTHTFFSDMDLKEQLETLAETTMLVSTVGSASFRMVFLPDNAKLVLVGAPGFKFKGEDGQLYPPMNPWREVDSCWKHLEYLEILKYDVMDAADVVPAQARSDLVAAKASENFNRRVYEQARMWDADVHIRPDRLAKLLEGVLREQAPR